MKAGIHALLAMFMGIGHSVPGMFNLPDSKPPRGARAAKLAINRGVLIWASQTQGTYVNPMHKLHRKNVRLHGIRQWKKNRRAFNEVF